MQQVLSFCAGAGRLCWTSSEPHDQQHLHPDPQRAAQRHLCVRDGRRHGASPRSSTCFATVINLWCYGVTWSSDVLAAPQPCVKSNALRKPCAAWSLQRVTCAVHCSACCARDLLLTRFGAMQVKSYFSNYGEWFVPLFPLCITSPPAQGIWAVKEEYFGRGLTHALLCTCRAQVHPDRSARRQLPRPVWRSRQLRRHARPGNLFRPLVPEKYGQAATWLRSAGCP